MHKRIVIVTLISLSAVACGGGGASSGAAGAGAPAAAAPASAQPSRSANRDIIARAEIEQAHGVSNAFDLVRRLRPRFFAQETLVRLNGQLLGDVSTLRSIDVTGLEEIRYYSIVEAETKWSGDRGRPVIAVTTRKLTGE